MLKIENVIALADFIELAQFEFDMDDPFVAIECLTPEGACGSAGCIGGHAAILWPAVRECYSSRSSRLGFRSDVLGNVLGLDEGEVDDLCYYPKDESGDDLHLRDVSRASAVEALRHLAETGEVRFIEIGE